MRRIMGHLFFFSALFLTGCAGFLPLVGFDAEGKPIYTRVDGQKYSSYLAEGLLNTEASVIPALEGIENNRGPDEHWKLNAAVVSVGVVAAAGTGPFKFSIQPRVGVAFTNTGKPPAPNPSTRELNQ